ncbi:hypothetical protein Taro_052039 [Colocasia esculenta]|uniref:CASP-like protein n=1 Tax=Colocasia esculenta TaxID=4460 RepID=A0A843XHE5_COLES|nr:hypothetical protein [Colocasia esculenta]
MASSPSRAATGTWGKTAPEVEYAGGRGGGSPPPPPVNMFHADLSLRLLLFATSLTALIVLVTSKQTAQIFPFPTLRPSFSVTRSAKFQNSPALIYLVVALAVTCFYSIVTLLTSASAVRSSSPSTKLLFHLVLLDAHILRLEDAHVFNLHLRRPCLMQLMAGVLAAATGAGGAVAYVGMKGNSHVQWNKICHVFDKFCRHTGSAVGVSLVASIVLVALVVLSAYSLYRRSR